MGQFTAALSVAQTVFSVVSSIQEASAQAAQIEFESQIQAQNLKLQARQMEFDAQRQLLDQRQLESQARDELIAANQEDIERRKELDETLSSIDAIRASRGLTISSPTAGAITRDIRSTASAELRTNRYNRLARRDTLKMEAQYAGNLATYSQGSAKAYRQQGNYTLANGKSATRRARTSGYTSAGISLLTGASSLNLGKTRTT